MKTDAHDPPGGFGRLFSQSRLLLTIGLLIFITYPGHILGARAFCYRDAGLLSYPLAYYLRESLLGGHLPFWNPYSNCGTPFLAQWNTMALYPFSLFYVLLPMPWALNCFLLGHLLLAGLGMWRLAKEWFGSSLAGCVAGLAWAWNGLSIQCLMWPTHTAGLAWMPWVVLLCGRACQRGGRDLVWAILAAAFQLLAGSPETVFLTWLVVAGVFITNILSAAKGSSNEFPEDELAPVGRGSRRAAFRGALAPQERRPTTRFGRFTESLDLQNLVCISALNLWRMLLPLPAGEGRGEGEALANQRRLMERIQRLTFVTLAAALLAAPQLFPWLDFLAHSDRGSGTGGKVWSLPLWGLANYFVPLFRNSPSLSGVYMQDEQQAYSSYYIGIVPLALAGIAVWRARHARTTLLAILALAATWLALGDAGLALKLARIAIPLLGFMRYPVKFLILTNFSVALLAGAGAAWLEALPQPKKDSATTLAKMGALTAIGVVLVLGAAQLWPFLAESRQVVVLNGLLRLVFLLGGIVILDSLLKHRQMRALIGFGFLLCLGLDICTHMPQQNPSVPAQAYSNIELPLTKVPRLGESRAMLSPDVERTMDQLVNPDLFALYLGQRTELFGDCNLLDDIPKVSGFMAMHLAAENKVASLLGSGPELPGLEEFLGVSQMATSAKIFEWEERTNFMPWATIGQKPHFLDEGATLKALSAPDFSPRQNVYLQPDAQSQIGALPDKSARILKSSIEPEKCVFETSSASNAMLVVAQAYYHCWQASVDGHPVPVLRANYAFQAVEVPGGRHEVRIFYVDRAFQIGVAFSVAALAICATVLWKAAREPAAGGN